MIQKTNQLDENFPPVMEDQPFSFDNLFAFPGDIAQYDTVRGRKKVAIIGAGIAGLTAGYELSKLGHQVRIFEASERIGGRIHTHYFSDGTYGEFGAMRIPENHHCVLHYINELGLKTRPFVSHNENAWYHARGIKTRIRDWERLLPKYKLANQERKAPQALYNELMLKTIGKLSDSDMWNFFNSDFTNPLLKNYEEQTIWQFLNSNFSDEALEYMDMATGVLRQKKASLLAILMDHFTVLDGHKVEVEGGMMKLVNALAAKLWGKIICNATIKKIEITENTTNLCWNQGGFLDKQETFDYVISTVPLTALLKIKFQPELDSKRQEAIRGVSYESAGKMLFHMRKRPWEIADNIYGGGSYSDLSFQQCWYPSDNAMKVENNSASLMGQNTSDMVPLWKAQNTELSYEPAVLTAAYVWGESSFRFTSLSESERMDMIIRDLNSIHPHIEQHIDHAVSLSWDDYSNSGFGAHAFFSPGEHQRYQKTIAMPYPKADPKVFFAGEHMAIIHGTLQGAVQSALDAVLDVLQAPAPKKSYHDLI